MPSATDRIVYLNGEFLSESEAKLSIFDRGFLFADGVYEVTAVVNGKLKMTHVDDVPADAASGTVQ